MKISYLFLMSLTSFALPCSPFYSPWVNSQPHDAMSIDKDFLSHKSHEWMQSCRILDKVHDCLRKKFINYNHEFWSRLASWRCWSRFLHSPTSSHEPILMTISSSSAFVLTCVNACKFIVTKYESKNIFSTYIEHFLLLMLARAPKPKQSRGL